MLAEFLDKIHSLATANKSPKTIQDGDNTRLFVEGEDLGHLDLPAVKTAHKFDTIESFCRILLGDEIVFVSQGMAIAVLDYDGRRENLLYLPLKTTKLWESLQGMVDKAIPHAKLIKWLSRLPDQCKLPGAVEAIKKVRWVTDEERSRTSDTLGKSVHAEVSGKAQEEIPDGVSLQLPVCVQLPAVQPVWLFYEADLDSRTFQLTDDQQTMDKAVDTVIDEVCKEIQQRTNIEPYRGTV